MEKKFKIVMLVTDKSNNIGDIVLSPDGKRLATLNCLTYDSEQPCTNQHLYIISDELIKEGDWLIFDNRIQQCISVDDEDIETTTAIYTKSFHQCKKIVASTDKTLQLNQDISKCVADLVIENKIWLPQIPESFINAYIKAYNE